LALIGTIIASSDGDFGKYFHLPVSVNGFYLPVNKKNQLTP
jgi:hypothetical protein